MAPQSTSQPDAAAADASDTSARPFAFHDLVEETDRGLVYDLSTLIDRRQVLKLAGFTTISAGLMSIAACAPSASGSASATAASSASAAGSADATAASCAVVPEETAGPYPGDGSNGPNVLTQSGIVRSDIRSSFGSYSGTAAGVANTVRLKVLSLSNGAAPLVGAAVYLWHCTREGGYSLYSQGVTDQNFLRGVQETDANGEVTFQSIFPAAYDGRWPHIHFEVYPSLDKATSASGKLRTSQLAFPKEVCDVVYATDGYEASVRNLARTSLTTDMVFRDGYSSQLATVTGDVAGGYLSTLTLAV